ncbi:carboxypeptidase-like regulatory domain-containing protein [Hymenobacter convexus]|uniref:carboxypeptidase-like regulatory domain-containing protein n=1 Tax=Hymenobacter sp. CA1UV-4 TaxID=3063782 RepID=UPI0027123034|nr:carboxypeptidase-like regulatory domain-containing protein [Hymenobacter sp. CA1UV-4]MDO7850269.1 carboxypeptidase-like regulatory domain-containing protein [Hymenobacter sp. CA1UV-4]
MRSAPVLHIPQPCSESWAAMTPTTAGRHCTACQKTVVDFTQKTDAEILALLAGAAGGRTCGRFAAGQLGRPLQRAAPAAPMPARWRTWLAAAVALWAVREGVGTAAKAQAPAEWRARYWGGPVPAAPAAEAKNAMERIDRPTESQSSMMGDTTLVSANLAAPLPVSKATQALVLRGVVTDVATNQGLPGAVVLVRGAELGASTNADGVFELTLPAQFAGEDSICFVVRFIGYETQEHTLARAEMSPSQRFQLGTATSMGLPEILVLPPAPWHPRSFYYWGKYWLTRPFRRS